MNKSTFLKYGVHARQSLTAIGVLTAVIAGSALFISSGSHATPVVNQPAPALTVTVASAKQTRWPSVMEASGAISPWQEAVIGAQVAGLRLDEVRVNVGDRVKRGQVLAVFDADLLAVEEARLKAAWQQAEANRLRALQLKGSGGISEQDVLQYVTQADIAKAQLQYAQLQLRYAQVIAPDDGLISARSATVGAVSGSGQELFRMIRQSRLEWRGELTAVQLARVKPGQRIELSLPDGTPATALVRQMAPSVDNLTRLGIVYADIQVGGTARAGMYAKGRVVLAESPALTVPAVSVIIRDGRSYVPTISSDRRVTLQPVTVGRRWDGAVEILSGITLRDTVAVQGAGFLNNGDVVRIVTNAPVVAGE